jgi:hypothetical protein
MSDDDLNMDFNNREVVIDVKPRLYDTKHGSKKTAVGLDFGGPYELDDPAVADVVKPAGAGAAGGISGVGTGGAANQKAFDDL